MVERHAVEGLVGQVPVEDFRADLHDAEAPEQEGRVAGGALEGGPLERPCRNEEDGYLLGAEPQHQELPNWADEGAEHLHLRVGRRRQRGDDACIAGVDHSDGHVLRDDGGCFRDAWRVGVLRLGHQLRRGPPLRLHRRLCDGDHGAVVRRREGRGQVRSEPDERHRCRLAAAVLRHGCGADRKEVRRKGEDGGPRVQEVLIQSVDQGEMLQAPDLHLGVTRVGHTQALPHVVLQAVVEVDGLHGPGVSRKAVLEPQGGTIFNSGCL
mmetsp:Transcript_39711/g.123763  ORF Transcript_39711/g.123763 Transcript_39711/m.123763 type:complete len:267 (-) Transcript_39711:803-1603(-)